MKRYNATNAAERGELTIKEVNSRVGYALQNLQNDYSTTRRRYPFSGGRILQRTTSGKHYRMPAPVASFLKLEIIDSPGAHDTVPPTVLVGIGETLVGLTCYVQGAGAELEVVVNGIRNVVEHNSLATAVTRQDASSYWMY